MAKPYTLGHWTKATLLAFRYIHGENVNGRYPKIKDISSGTLKNWCYVLKRGGYLLERDDGGILISKTGVELYEQFQRNPPQEKRGKKRFKEPLNQENKPDSPDVYHVVVQGKKLSVEMLLTEDEAMEIISFISSLKKKK